MTGCGGGGGYSDEVANRFLSDCQRAWDEPFCACALDYFEDQGNEDWFEDLWKSPPGVDFREPAAWLVGVPGFALFECEDEFEG